MLKRQLCHLQTYLGGIKYMTGLPDIVITVDQQQEYRGWFFHHPIHNKSNETWRTKNKWILCEGSFVFFFKPTIRSRSPLLMGSRLISLPLATQMFQFAKFEKSKERRLATELGYGFPIGDPWIADGISPWPFASKSVLPSQCPGIHQMHSFRSCIEDRRPTPSRPK